MEERVIAIRAELEVSRGEVASAAAAAASTMAVTTEAVGTPTSGEFFNIITRILITVFHSAFCISY